MLSNFHDIIIIALLLNICEFLQFNFNGYNMKVDILQEEHGRWWKLEFVIRMLMWGGVLVLEVTL